MNPNDATRPSAVDARLPASASPTVAAMLGETVSVICVMALYGPPVVLLAAPWLFLVLMLSGPFALVATLVLALLAAAALVGGIAAILATPYLLLRRYRTVAPTVARVPVTLRRAVA